MPNRAEYEESNCEQLQQVQPASPLPASVIEYEKQFFAHTDTHDETSQTNYNNSKKCAHSKDAITM